MSDKRCECGGIGVERAIGDKGSVIQCPQCYAYLFADLPVERDTPMMRMLLKILLDHGGVARPDLIRQFPTFPNTTVHDNLTRLMVYGYLQKNLVETHTRGRPKVYWVIAGDPRYYPKKSYIYERAPSKVEKKA